MFGRKKKEAQRKAALEEQRQRDAAIKAERESTILNKIDSGLAEAAAGDFTDKLEKLEELQNFHTLLKQGEASSYYFYRGNYRPLDAPFKEALATRGKQIDTALEKLLIENYAPLSKPTVQKAFFELHPGLVDRFNRISLKVEFAKAKEEADAEAKTAQEGPATAPKQAYGPYNL